MRVFLAESAGFCFGVEKAVEGVYENLGKKKMVTYGPIIHNKNITDDLKRHNVDIIKNIDEVLDETVVIRAHGVPPSVYEGLQEKGIDYIDYTCPFVKKIHRVAKEEYEKGKKIIIIGDSSHPEIIGINGFTGDSSLIINNLEEAKNLEILPHESYSVVVQTTFENEKFVEMVEFLQKKNYKIDVFDTICSATHDRQKSAHELSKKVDCMIVLGDKKSSNSTKLYNICKKNCEKTYFVENIYEIQLKNLKKYDKIGITAGASTPLAIIEEAVKLMTEQTNETNENFEQMLDENFKTLHSGEVVTGTVISISEHEISVNLGSKADGIVTRSEVTEDDTIDIRTLFKAGDEIEVYVVKINDGEGNVVLSHKRISEQKNFETLEAAFNSKAVVKGKVLDLVKGGLIALINGARVFVPASQATSRYTEDLSPLKGMELDFNIIEFEAERRRVLAGRRELAIKEEENKKLELLRNLKPGTDMEGEVRRIVTFGAFVDLGGIDGLIHITEISWIKSKRPPMPFEIGDKVKVRILEVDEATGKVSLSYRANAINPWDNIEEKYPVDSYVNGTVVRMAEFGAFIALEEGVDGLVHISNISLNRITKPEEALTIGQEIEAKVIETDSERQRISLSIKAVLEEEAFEEGYVNKEEDLEEVSVEE